MADDGEQIEPWLLHHAHRIQRWQQGHTTHWASRHVILGRLPDGRWYVDHTDPTIGCRAYPSEQQARDTIRRITASGDWREVPANFGPDGKPIGEGWTRRGGSWVRDDYSAG